jgi:hypothetical protein
MKDMTLIEKPLVLAKLESASAHYLCCLVSPLISCGVLAIFQKIALICSSRLVHFFDMELDSQTVQLYDARNDFSCHKIVRNPPKINPLSIIQDTSHRSKPRLYTNMLWLEVVSILTGIKEGPVCQ